jgi:putative oxidoreductase
MKQLACSVGSVMARVMLVAVFWMSALGSKIPKYSQTADVMRNKGIPLADFALLGAIIFLIVGSASVMMGYKARIGASLLLVFIVLATYFFHDFWNYQDGAQQREMIQFFKNMSIAGALLFIVTNGSGLWSWRH